MEAVEVLRVLKGRVPPGSAAGRAVFSGGRIDPPPAVGRVAVPGGVLAFRVTTPASQPDRTLLFFHGGGFTTGSTA
ncbi:MAG: alpha/beta hydrolase, partial [Methanoculleus sp.]|nr:alpha/beta hydrolase [Methanoculleus sp.]